MKVSSCVYQTYVRKRSVFYNNQGLAVFATIGSSHMNSNNFYIRPSLPRRSVLYVPADNTRALVKSLKLNCDAVIYDLEDAILPDHKDDAREQLHAFLTENFPNGTSNDSREIIIRINSLASEWGKRDLLAARSLMPSAILTPKVSEIDDVIEISDALLELDAPNTLRLWAMIETPKGVLNAPTIAQYARTPGTRLDCFVVGTNDLLKETGAKPIKGRPYISTWLMQIILAARAYELDVIDGVFNDFNDLVGYKDECDNARAMGFDGKSLIHPNQISLANDIFGISDEDFSKAETIIAAFREPENKELGVIQIAGEMVERLHLEMAEKIVLKANIIKQREG
jgi:citrate lyase subunit beta/citryl-CoA lyase